MSSVLTVILGSAALPFPSQYPIRYGEIGSEASFNFKYLAIGILKRSELPSFGRLKSSSVVMIQDTGFPCVYCPHHS